MRSLVFATCLALGAGSTAMVAPAQARVDINLPGVHIGSGHHRDWRRDERRHEGYRDHWRYDHGYRRYGYRDWR